MGLISRHAGAPFANGEVLSGTDLENDISTAYTLLNGNLDNSNVSAGAAIAGTKLAAASVPAAQIVASSLTTSQMDASAVTKGNVQSASGLGVTLPVGVAYVDVTGIAGFTLTPGSASDLIVLDFDCAAILTGTGGLGTNAYDFAFSIGGVDTVDLGAIVFNGPTLNHVYSVHVSWMFVAGGTSPIALKPRVRKEANAGAGQSAAYAGAGASSINRIFRAMILPIK